MNAFPVSICKASRRPYASPASQGWAIAMLGHDLYFRGDGWCERDTAMLWPNKEELEEYLFTWSNTSHLEIIWVELPEIPGMTGWAVQRDSDHMYDTGPRWGLFSPAREAYIHSSEDLANDACPKNKGYSVVPLSYPNQA